MRRPEIIILDEATSALDADNERSLLENLDTIYQNNTLILITHRTSSLKNFDTIFVLDKGSIVEKGNFNELMQNPHGYFYKFE